MPKPHQAPHLKVATHVAALCIPLEGPTTKVSPEKTLLPFLNSKTFPKQLSPGEIFPPPPIPGLLAAAGWILLLTVRLPGAPHIQINVPAIYPNAFHPNIIPFSSPGTLSTNEQ